MEKEEEGEKGGDGENKRNITKSKTLAPPDPTYTYKRDMDLHIISSFNSDMSSKEPPLKTLRDSAPNSNNTLGYLGEKNDLHGLIY